MTEAERRYEALAERMEEMKREMIALADEVHRARTPATEPDPTDRLGRTDRMARDLGNGGTVAVGHPVAKAGARALKAKAEAQLDDLARSMQEPGESIEKAYTRAIETDLGRSMMQTLEDATRLAQGQATEAMIAEHRKSLA